MSAMGKSAALHFGVSVCLKTFLHHAIGKRDNFWLDQYFPAYERLSHCARKFKQRLAVQD